MTKIAASRQRVKNLDMDLCESGFTSWDKDLSDQDTKDLIICFTKVEKHVHHTISRWVNHYFQEFFFNKLLLHSQNCHR